MRGSRMAKAMIGRKLISTSLVQTFFGNRSQRSLQQCVCCGSAGCAANSKLTRGPTAFYRDLPPMQARFHVWFKGKCDAKHNSNIYIQTQGELFKWFRQTTTDVSSSNTLQMQGLTAGQLGLWSCMILFSPEIFHFCKLADLKVD